MSLGLSIGRAARDAVRVQAGAGFAVATAGAKLWGRMLGGSFRKHGDLTVVSDLPKWAFGRGGTCVGGVVLSNRELNDTVLEHEDVHRKQWRRYGLLFIPMYFAAGIDPLQNRFEIEADLVKGGYVKAR